MKVLELFKGTGSVGKTIQELYPEAEVYSVDILKKYKPTYCGDILKWDYKQFEPNHFTIIWASPECKVFSKLQHTWLKTGKRGENGKWDSMEHLNRVRQEHGQFSAKAVEIINYFKPKAYFIENPYDSAMKDLPHMKDLPSFRFDYCQYGFPYKKPTRIWTNLKFDNVICDCKERHKQRVGIGQGSEFKYHTEWADTKGVKERYRIPFKLLRHLLKDLD